MQPSKAPIGYWIKQADQLLTKGIDQIQASAGLTRTSWQALNTIYEKEQITLIELQEIIKPFADINSLNLILQEFKKEGLLHKQQEKLALSFEGIELYKLALTKQNTFRQKAMAGISEQEYEATILTLQKIINNVSDNRT